MPNPRKDNRLNLRFANNEIDDLAIVAESEGLPLPSWAKATLLNAQRRAAENEILHYKALECVLIIFKVMERVANPNDVSAARHEVEEYFKRVKGQ